MDGSILKTLPISVFVAVGIGVTPDPPHRSRRAELPHRAPASGSDARAAHGIGMHDPRVR